jgi:hypothetical protein
MNIDNLITMVSAVGGPKAHVSIVRNDGKVELRIVGVWLGERVYDGVNAAEVASKAEVDMTPLAFDKLTAMRRDVALLESAMRS